jgi:hypothetical protein
MREVVAMLPMAGSGSRLGMPFPKPLAPTFTSEGIKPLYWHTMRQLSVAGVDSVFGIVAADDLMLWKGFDAFPIIPKPIRGNAVSTVKWGAQFVASDEDVLVCLPDLVLKGTFYPKYEGIKTLVDWHQSFNQGALSVGLARGAIDVLDGLYSSDEKPIFKDKLADWEDAGAVPEGYLAKGWAALLGPRDIFMSWDDSLSFAGNINLSDWRPVDMDSSGYDLGTEKRYMSLMDMRKDYM